MADTATQQGTEADPFTFESAASKEFPLAPEGVHKVTVIRALFSMKDNTFQPEKGKQPTISLMLESDQEYKVEGEEKPRRYRLFKTMKVSDHAQSAMKEFFNSVCGMEVPLTEAKRINIGKPEVEKAKDGDGDDKTHFRKFEHLTFSVVVKHEKNKDTGKVRDKVDSIIPCSPEAKKANADLFSAA